MELVERGSCLEDTEKRDRGQIFRAAQGPRVLTSVVLMFHSTTDVSRIYRVTYAQSLMRSFSLTVTSGPIIPLALRFMQLLCWLVYRYLQTRSRGAQIRPLQRFQ